MKPKIHPNFKEAKIVCACGAEFKTMSAISDLRVEVCSKCHPFFTGKRKYLDAAGRVEKFRQKYNLPDPLAEEASTKEPLAEETPTEEA